MKKMYFEDIYEKIRPFWNERFSLKDIEETKTYVKSVLKNYNDIEYLVNVKQKEEYTEWESNLVFTMYQALTAHAIRRWEEEGVEEFDFCEVSINVFEEYYRKNMEPEDKFDGNPEYMANYKGLKNKEN